MAQSLRRSRLPMRGPRRLTSWDVGPGNTTVVPLTASGKTLFAGVSPVRDGLTLIRLRGQLSAALTSSSITQGGYNCALGVGIVTVNAFNVGTTAVPGPLTDEAWDGWLWHQYFRLTSSGTIAGGASTDEDLAGVLTTSFRTEVDSKAMRKVNNEEIIIAVLEVVEVGVATAFVQFISCTLLKLP